MEPLLALTGVGKSFGAVKALDDVAFEVRAGEVVGLLGDNGAGKSTLAKILSGVHSPDRGTVTWRGERVSLKGPSDARALGIATVYQDLALCDNLDVVANLHLGRESTRAALMDEDSMEAAAVRLLGTLSATIPNVRSAVASLSGGQRQIIAIARSLVDQPALVILDEPTAALGVASTAEVLDLIERLREQGLGVVLISHNMDDVLAVTDRIVVLRLGRNGGTFDTATVKADQVVAAITGGSDNPTARRAARMAARRG